MLLALVEPAAASDVSWVGPTKFVLQPLLTLGTLAMLFRVVLSWFPKYDLKEMPWILVAAPTEPILKFTRLVQYVPTTLVCGFLAIIGYKTLKSAIKRP